MIIEDWCREVLDILSIGLNLRGETPPGRGSTVLFVANHVSWIDILIINACRRVRFVAKTEVRQWSLVGWMAARTGILFLNRTSPHDLARVITKVTASLRQGHCVALFPEGTTTDGTSLHVFHSGLFESAIAAEALVWPLAISYKRPDGSLDSDIAFIGDQSLVSSIVNVLTRPVTRVQLSFTAPVNSSAGYRRKLTVWSRHVIEQSLAGHSRFTAPSQSPMRFPSDESFPPLTAA